MYLFKFQGESTEDFLVTFAQLERLGAFPHTTRSDTSIIFRWKEIIPPLFIMERADFQRVCRIIGLDPFLTDEEMGLSREFIGKELSEEIDNVIKENSSSNIFAKIKIP